MTTKAKKERVLEFLESLPLWSRPGDKSEQSALKEERANLAGVKTRLLDILNHDSLINTGRVQIIGLQSLKDQLGDRWEGHRGFVHASLQAILRRKLDSTDVFFRHDQDDYVIVFASLGYAAAKLVCAGVMQELNTLLLGDDDMGSVTVRTAVGVVEGKLLLEQSSIDDVLHGLDEVEPDSELEWDREKASDGPSEMDRPSSDASMNASIRWKIMSPSEEENRQKAEQSWTPINEDALDEGVVPDQFEMVYRPMWSPKHEIISTFTASFVGTDQEGQLRKAYSFVHSPKLIRAMDVDVLKRASETTLDLFARKQRFVVAIPHHYETVTNWSRLYEYAEHCKAIPNELQNYVILACDDFPPGVPPSKLLMIGYALKPLCRGLAAYVSWTTRDLTPYSDAGFSTVGLFIPRDVPFAAIQIRIEEFAELARRSGLQTAVLNVHDETLCEIVRKAGIDFVMGRLIGDYQKAPSHMIRLPWDEIKARQRLAV